MSTPPGNDEEIGTFEKSLCHACYNLPGFKSPPNYDECTKCFEGGYTDRRLRKRSNRPEFAVHDHVRQTIGGRGINTPEAK